LRADGCARNAEGNVKINALNLSDPPARSYHETAAVDQARE
jgi:hypothetical protein